MDGWLQLRLKVGQTLGSAGMIGGKSKRDFTHDEEKPKEASNDRTAASLRGSTAPVSPQR